MEESKGERCGKCEHFVQLTEDLGWCRHPNINGKRDKNQSICDPENFKLKEEYARKMAEIKTKEEFSFREIKFYIPRFGDIIAYCTKDKQSPSISNEAYDNIVFDRMR